MKVISIINMKGGVAKTTSCHSIASRLGQLGKKVLVIDWDPQGDLSYMVFDENEITKNTRNLIDGETIENCILVSKDFDMVATADEEA
ncbi:MAG: ParA family protein, partial [Fusobacteriaceae bacterium]